MNLSLDFLSHAHKQQVLCDPFKQTILRDDFLVAYRILVIPHNRF